MKKRVICVRTRLVREGSVLYESENGKRTITSPEEAAKFAASFFNGSDKEMIYVCTLSGHNEPVAMEMVAKGSVNWCTADISQIYKTAIISNAAGIICFHNHPSGSIEPSRDDKLITEKMETAGKYLDIPLRDHIILGENGAFYSFCRSGELGKEIENNYE